MKKYIIIYYSRKGTVKKAAERLYKLLGEEQADIEEIIDEKKRSGLKGFILAAIDARRDHITRIGTQKYNPSDYEEVVIFTPIWAGKMSDAIRTYLAMHQGDIKTATLVTCAGSDGGEPIATDIFLRFAIKVKDVISLRSREVKRDEMDVYFRNFGVFDGTLDTPSVDTSRAKKSGFDRDEMLKKVENEISKDVAVEAGVVPPEKLQEEKVAKLAAKATQGTGLGTFAKVREEPEAAVPQEAAETAPEVTELAAEATEGTSEKAGAEAVEPHSGVIAEAAALVKAEAGETAAEAEALAEAAETVVVQGGKDAAEELKEALNEAKESAAEVVNRRRRRWRD